MVRQGFTLIEVLVATVLVAVAVVGSLAGVSAIQRANYNARTADLLQQLAQEKIDDAVSSGDPTTYATSGDFSDRGYPGVTWSLDVESSSASYVYQVKSTATRGSSSQAITQYVYVQPSSTSTTSSTSGTGQ